MSYIKDCDNCKHLIRHYILTGNRYMPLSSGHCGNRKLIKQRRKNVYRLQENCPYWEQRQDEIAEKAESIENEIAFMRRNLDQILNILQNYEDYGV